VACVGEKRNCYLVLLGKPAKGRLFGRPKCKRDDIIKMCVNL
jgi:hypothetical protein